MPKLAKPGSRNFAKRLAELRKVAGYTQQQLADEIGVSRRVIGYYETKAENPPASFLTDLARALNLSVDELVGLKPSRPKRPAGGVSTRLERKLRQIERLDSKPKQQILAFIDTVLVAEELKKAAGQ
jgi:transcriptional regulator with XRE-family HTH domain